MPPEVIQKPGWFFCPAFLWGVAVGYVARLASLAHVRSTASGWPEEGGQAGVPASGLLASHWPGLVTWPHRAPREARPHHSYWMAVRRVRTHMGGVLVPLDCSDKIPRMGNLKTAEMHCLQFWRLGSPKSGCQHGHIPVRSLPWFLAGVVFLCPHMQK